MYNVFARFETKAQAQKACKKITDTVSGITRAGIRMVVPPHAHDEHNPSTADAISRTVLYSAGIDRDQWQSVSDTAMAAAKQEAEYDRRTGYEPPRDSDFILCAQGSREAVEHASKLLRSLGANSVDIRDAKGSFLSGQPPIL